MAALLLSLSAGWRFFHLAGKPVHLPQNFPNLPAPGGCCSTAPNKNTFPPPIENCSGFPDRPRGSEKLIFALLSNFFFSSLLQFCGSYSLETMRSDNVSKNSERCWRVAAGSNPGYCGRRRGGVSERDNTRTQAQRRVTGNSRFDGGWR